MRAVLIIAILALALLLSGCWTLSVFPLYTDKDTSFDPALLGRWGDPESDSDKEVWIFEQNKDNSYHLTVKESDKADGVFDVHRLVLAGKVYLDFYPEEPESGNDFYMSHVIPAHSFWRMQLAGDSLRLAMFDSQWLRQKIEAGEVNIAYQRRDDLYVLTAPTPDLQTFVIKYTDEAFDSDQSVAYRLK